MRFEFEPGFSNKSIPNLQATMERLRSQVLGIIVLALVFLLIACARYYFKLG